MNGKNSYAQAKGRETMCMNRHAVVIGGSLAGLLAARVLADRFDRVTIIERDHFPEEAVPRKGVPQSRHVHVLMQRGRMILEELFPGLGDEMVAAGAHASDMAADTAWLTPAGWGVRYPSNLTMLSFTRDLLDWNVRRRLAAFPQVRFFEGAAVAGLLPDADKSGVTGVAFRLRSGDGEEGARDCVLRADLVVDASGRASAAPQWLEAIGYAPPRETIISAFLGYASRLYQPPPGFKADWKNLYIQAAPPDRTRACVFFPVEGNRWLVTLCGGGRDYPPADDAGFLEFARSLPSQIVYDAIKDALPLTPTASFRATENRLRHVEEMSRWPENFIILGDAVCAFNPVYGQGMTTAALGALTLKQILRETDGRSADGNLGGLARRFQKRLAEVNAAPWMLATGEDYRYREVVGGAPTLKTRLMHRYMDEVVRLSTENIKVRSVLLEVFHMVKPPAALFRPGIFARVLRQTFKSLFHSSGAPARKVKVSDAATYGSFSKTAEE